MADASINMNQMKTFVAEIFGGQKVNKAVAQGLGITEEQFEQAQTDQDETTISIEEALEDDDIFANFASKFIDEKDAQVKSEPDKEKEKNRPVEQKNQKKS